MGGVTDRAGKSGVDVEGVLTEAGVRHDVGKVVTLGAQRIRTACRWIHDRRKKILDRRSRSGGGRKAWSYLAELVAPLQNMGEARTVRSVWSAAAEFAVVVAVVAVGTENACTQRAPLEYVRPDST